jgi:CheY-like chemotaxis protein
MGTGTTTDTTTLYRHKAESLEAFAGGIAHDFNNLLMGVTGNLELALKDLPPDSPTRRRLDQAYAAAQRATDLTRQLLTYSGKGRFLKQPVNLNDLVADTNLPATVHRRLDPQLPDISADPEQLRQVIQHLYLNASEAGGAVTISTGIQRCDAAFLSQSRLPPPPPGAFLYLDVTDAGCGMDKATVQRAFDPFFSTKGTGRGLGLSTVLGTVRAHGGALLLRSEPGKGTAVRVLLPLTSQDPETSTQTLELVVTPPSATKADTVLIVDDEEVIRLLCTAMVEQLGYQPLCAVDGLDGVEKFRANATRIACVILDLTMPRMDGMTALIEMRRIKPDVKVILSSGYDAQEATQRFVGHGVAGFLQKPYRLEALQAMMERVAVAPVEPKQ